MQDNSHKPEPDSPTTPFAAEQLVMDGTAAVSPAPTFEEAPAVEVMPSLEDLLKQAELKAAEHHDAWLRAKADTENMRRRAQEDIAKAGKFAAERFAGELLAVKDSLEAALANENQSAENLKSGVELTLRQLVSAFEKSNLTELFPLGEKFDPHKHQAISQIEAPDDTTEPNTVLTVLQKGYSLHERVIRPALVVVSKAKATPAA
jgi:molecular chaperone GrpE